MGASTISILKQTQLPSIPLPPFNQPQIHQDQPVALTSFPLHQIQYPPHPYHVPQPQPHETNLNPTQHRYHQKGPSINFNPLNHQTHNLQLLRLEYRLTETVKD